jgi:hypothetical protein
MLGEKQHGQHNDEAGKWSGMLVLVEGRHNIVYRVIKSWADGEESSGCEVVV